MSPAATAREEILRRIRAATTTTAATATATAPEAAREPAPVERAYLTAHVESGLVDLLAENLADYRATVHRATAAQVPGIIARLLAQHGDTSVVVPEALPREWLSGLAEPAAPTSPAPATVALHPETPELTARDLDSIHAVVTGCALAIAETGTIVLDSGPGQGRRALTLVPDHHICVIRCPEQIVASVNQALPLLDPTRPLTWIAGPSATSDIELDRVEGVHGPRKLDVILVEG